LNSRAQRARYNLPVREIRGLLIGYAVIALLAGWPILSVVTAGVIASWNGCTLNEGGVNPCVVSGRDIGGTLYSMGVMGWFMIATIPLGVVAALAWTIGWLIRASVKRRRASRVNPVTALR
jgi:hypothetical protein